MSQQKNISEERILIEQERIFSKRFKGASLSKLEIPSWAGEKIGKWLKEPKNILLFHGNPGIGKTYFCASLIEWALKSFNTFRYHREEELLRKLRQHIQDESGDYAIMLEYLIDDEFVILDDVGSGMDPDKENKKNYEWREEIFFNFLDYRYRTLKPTVITSNFTKADFEKIYAKRIFSRLFASENTIIPIYDGLDKRREGL